MPDQLHLRPLRALTFAAANPDELGRRLCPPYDVIDEAARARLRGLDDLNAVRLVLPSSYDDAARLLRDWRAAGALVADERPALYVYEEQTPAGHVQRGLVGAVRLSPAEAGVILPHENTMAGPVADRLALMGATDANLEPIFLLYEGGGAASAAVAAADRGTPLRQARTPDGVRHRVWALREPETLQAIDADLATRRALIADGHHRYATYLRYQQLHREAGDGAGPWDYGLAYLVDGATFGPQVHPIHRVIATLPAARAADAAARVFRVSEVAHEEAMASLADAGRGGPAFVVSDGRARAWLLREPDPAALLAAVPTERSPAWRELDVTIAHYLLIREVWGLADDEATVGYSHALADALAGAAAAEGTALLLNPTPVASIAAVATAGDRMPRKSTLFTPKPASGLLIRAFDLDG